jgi:hypothetical protein
MLRLPDVTLVMVETRRHEIARLVALDALRKVEFGDVVVLSDRNLRIPGARWVAIEDAPDKIGWERQFWYETPKHVRTSHMLFVEWDAGVWCPSHWRADYLAYDYVGAPWWWYPVLNVGNGGFSLRSRELIQHVARNAYWMPVREPGDNVLCRLYRPRLELCGFKWAPFDLAMLFSLERTRPAENSRHFGFHGVFNWQHCLDPDELERRRAILGMLPEAA